MELKLFVAMKAFVEYNGKVLLVRESPSYKEGTNVGKFDVPGGRVKPGEKWNQVLLREVKEETGLAVEIGRPFFVGEWRPMVQGEQWQVIGMFFQCAAPNDTIVLSEDHAEYLWIDPREYAQFPLIENLVPAFQQYLTSN